VIQNQKEDLKSMFEFVLWCSGFANSNSKKQYSLSEKARAVLESDMRYDIILSFLRHKTCSHSHGLKIIMGHKDIISKLLIDILSNRLKMKTYVCTERMQDNIIYINR
jgi:hypothetical protein